MTDTTPADEREQFEAWFIESRSPNDSRYMKRNGDGYVEFTLTVAWEAWQARAALEREVMNG